MNENKPETAEPQEVAQALEALRQMKMTHVEWQFSYGAKFGRELAASLRKLGWRVGELISTCTKATFEQRLTQTSSGDCDIQITSSFFFGEFTQVEFRNLR